MARRSDTGPFAIVPEWLLDSSVSDGAIRQYAILARHADKDDGACWPSRAVLAARQHCSEASVKRRTKELVDAGALLSEARHAGDGSQQSNLYVVLRAAPVTQGRCKVDPPPRVTPDPQNESHLELEPLHTPSPSEDADGFAAFWHVYPRTKEKGRALKAWLARVHAGADPADLVRAAENYATACRANRTPLDKRKYPATFLSGTDDWKEWLDGDPEAGAVTAQDPHRVGSAAWNERYRLP